MAILQVNKAQQQSQRKEADPSTMDKISQALGIAGNILKIGQGTGLITTEAQDQEAELNRLKLAQAERQSQAEQDIAKGNIDTPGARRLLAKEGQEVSEGAIAGRFSQPVTAFQVPEGQQGPEGPTKFITSKSALDTFAKLQKQRADGTAQPRNAIEIPEALRAKLRKKGVGDEEMDFVAAGGGGRSPMATLNRLAEQDEPTSSEAKVVKQFNESDKIISDLVKSVKSDWVGPVDGRIPSILTPPQQVAFRSKVGRLADAYRQAITGAGASEQEIARLETRLPGPTDTFNNFMAKAQDIQNELASKRDNYLNTLEDSGKNITPFRQRLEQTAKAPAFNEPGPERNKTTQGQKPAEDERALAQRLLDQRKAATAQRGQ